MRKHLLFIALMLITGKSSAQFTVYKPVIVDRNGNWVNRNNETNSPGLAPFDINPYNFGSTPQQPQVQESQVISTRGYYINNNQWNSVLIKVQIIGDNVYVVGIKRQSVGWTNEKTRAYSTELMQKEIKDSFDYYIGDYSYGKIYF